MATPEFVHNSARDRFEIHLDGEVIGKSYYRVEPGRRVFTHTEVDPEYQGRGLASQLITVALDDTREAGQRLVAQCPAVAAYIAKHPGYEDLVDRDVSPR